MHTAHQSRQAENADSASEKYRYDLGGRIASRSSGGASGSGVEGELEQVKGELREAVMQSLASLGQAQEAYEAQKAAEAANAALTARNEALVGALAAERERCAMIASDRWASHMTSADRLGEFDDEKSQRLSEKAGVRADEANAIAAALSADAAKG